MRSARPPSRWRPTGRRWPTNSRRTTAITRLLTDDGTVPLEDEAPLGLERAGSITKVVRVQRALTDHPSDQWPDGAFDRSGGVEDD